jgi:type IV pilus assembly protein PilE
MTIARPIFAAGEPRRTVAQSRRAHGFSLLELVVALAIVAILASLAQPAYRAQQLRVRRTEAIAALMQIAALQERHCLQHRTYTLSLEAAPPAGLGLRASSENGRYAIAITAADAAGFSATATAVGNQAADSRCAAFTIDETGARTATSPECWSR